MMTTPNSTATGFNILVGGVFGVALGAVSAATLGSFPILAGATAGAIPLMGISAIPGKKLSSFAIVAVLAIAFFATVGLAMLTTGASFIVACKFTGILAGYFSATLIIAALFAKKSPATTMP